MLAISFLLFATTVFCNFDRQEEIKKLLQYSRRIDHGLIRLEHVVQDIGKHGKIIRPASTHWPPTITSPPRLEVRNLNDNSNHAVPVGVLELGSSTYTLQKLDDGDLLFGSETITANAAAATIQGQPVSFGVSGLIIDGSKTFPVSAKAVKETQGSLRSNSSNSVPSGVQTVVGNGPTVTGFSQFSNEGESGKPQVMTSEAPERQLLSMLAVAGLVGLFAFFLV